MYTVKVNDKVYSLNRFSPNEFNRENCIIISNCSDVSQVMSDFYEFDKLDFYENDKSVAAYTAYYSYDSLQYQNNEIYLYLKKMDVASQIEKLEQQINPTVDVEGMNIDEYKNYILNLVAKDCEADIYRGKEIVLSDGTTSSFSFNLQDQLNWGVLYTTVNTSPLVKYLPYHSNGQECKLYSREDIIKIYMELIINLISKTTYCNAINMYVNSLEDRELISQIKYGMELPEEYKLKVDEIINETMQSVISVLPKNEDVSSDEVEESTEE